MSVPRGASSGQRLRLKGQESDAKGTAGDQYVRLKIVLPEKITEGMKRPRGVGCDLAPDDPRAKLWRMATLKLGEREVVAAVRQVQLRGRAAAGCAKAGCAALGEDGPVYDELDVARIRLVCDLQNVAAARCGSGRAVAAGSVARAAPRHARIAARAWPPARRNRQAIARALREDTGDAQ
ncbi:MAG: hypothetical protein R3D53_08835 [Paracoccaceae bacterium]